MTTTAYLAVSLDGFIADPDGGVEWLHELPNPEGSDYGFSDFMQGIDALVMGRKTFEVVHGFGLWPYDKPVFVLSQTLEKPPEGYEERIEVVRGEIGGVLASLRGRGFEHLYVDGGALVQSCLEAGLLDELVLTRIPVILGGGIPLFAPDGNRVWLDHRSTEVLGVGLVKSHYAVRRSSSPTF